MGLVRCYNVLFNVCHCVVSLALIGLSIYLLVANTSAFSFVFLGISCFWLFTGILGLIINKCECGFKLWGVALTLVFLFQTACFCVFTFAEDKAMEVISDMDGSTDTKVQKAKEFLDDHADAVKAVLAIGAGFQLFAIISAFCCSGPNREELRAKDYEKYKQERLNTPLLEIDPEPSKWDLRRQELSIKYNHDFTRKGGAAQQNNNRNVNNQYAV